MADSKDKKAQTEPKKAAAKKGFFARLLEGLNRLTKNEYFEEVVLAMAGVCAEEEKLKQERIERLKREKERKKREAEESKKPKELRRVKILKREIPGLRRRSGEEDKPQGPPTLKRRDVQRSQANYYASYLMIAVSVLFAARGLLFWGNKPFYAMVMWGVGALVFAFYRHLNVKSWRILFKYKDDKKWIFPYEIGLTMIMVVLGGTLLAGGLKLIGQRANDMLSLLGVLLFFLILIAFKTTSIQRRNPDKSTELVLQTALFITIFGVSVWYFLSFVLPAMLLMLFAIVMVSITYNTDPLHRSPMPVGLRLLYTLLVIGLTMPFLFSSFQATVLRPRERVIKYGKVISRLPHRPAHVAISDDAHRIVCSYQAGERWKLGLYSTQNGEELVEIEAGEQECHPVFLDDPGKLAFDGVVGGRRNIYVADVYTAEGIQLTDANIAPFGGASPYCRENRNFYYVRKGRSGDSIEYIRDDAKFIPGEQPLIYKTANEIKSVSPSPRGDAIIWVERIGSEEKVYLMDLTTRLKKIIADNSEIKVLERWTPRGRQLVEVLRMFMEKYGLREPAGLPIKLGHAVWSLDNRTFGYITTKGKRQAIRVLHRDGLYERRVYKTDGGKLSGLSLSPDGKKIICQLTKSNLLFRDTIKEIKVVRIEDRKLRSLVPKNIDYFAPAYSKDGTKIAFASNSSLWYPSRGYGLWVALLR